jgi:AraC family transcriptional regulator
MFEDRAGSHSDRNAVMPEGITSSLPTCDERKPSMKIVAATIAGLGRPTLMRAIGRDQSSRALIARWKHGDVNLELGASDAVRVAISLRGGHVIRQGHGIGHSTTIHPGSVSVWTVGTTTDLEIEGEADVVQIFVDPTCFEEVIGGDSLHIPFFDNHDPELQTRILQLLVAAYAPDPDNDLLMESELWRLVEHLVAGHPSYRRERWIGGLAHDAMRRVEELISYRLTTTEPGPSVVELATLAGLSVHHFIRAFKRSTGNTPHQHVMARRIECAMDLLRRPDGSVAEVSSSVGYASPSHFVASFRRRLGVTPGTYRAAVVNRAEPLNSAYSPRT